MPAGHDFDALLMGSLYGELSAVEESRLQAHLAAHPSDHELMRSLARTRDAIRSSAALAVVEPPQAISALLLQEAARRAPRASAAFSGAPSLGGKLGRWLATLVAHPALAAAAMAVVAVGAAGTLYLRGHHEVAEPTASAPAVASNEAAAAAPPPAADPAIEGIATTTAAAAPSEKLEQREAKADPVDSFGVDLAKDGAMKAGERERAKPTVARLEASAATEPQDFDQKQADKLPDLVIDAPKGKPAKTRSPKYIEATTSELDVPLKELSDEDEAEEAKPVSRTGAAGAGSAPARDATLDRRQDAQPKKPVDLAGSKDEQSSSTIREPNTGKAAALPPASSTPVTQGRYASPPAPVVPGAAPAPAPMSPPSNGPTRAPAQAAGQAAAPAAPEASSDGGDVATEAAPTNARTYDDKWAKGEHVRLVRLARGNKCTEAAAVARTLAERAPRYYADKVVADRELRACSTAIRDALNLRPDAKRKATRAGEVDSRK